MIIKNEIYGKFLQENLSVIDENIENLSGLSSYEQAIFDLLKLHCLDEDISLGFNSHATIIKSTIEAVNQNLAMLGEIISDLTVFFPGYLTWIIS